MNIAAYTRFGHRILHISDPIGLTTDTSPLRQAIETAFEDGELHLAISFPRESFLSSRTLALLIENAEKATAKGGTLTIIAPSIQILEVLAIFDLGLTLRTVREERELLLQPSAPVKMTA